MSMSVPALDQAMLEAKRFLETALIAMNTAERIEYVKGHQHLEGGQYVAAVKRASMDLTRALVAVRS